MRKKHPLSFALWLLCLVLVASLASAEETSHHWPRLRGPFATGLPAVTDNPNLPDTWSRTGNIAWKIDIPGVGWFSPVIWGEKVLITSVTNKKEADNAQPKPGLYLGPGKKEIPSGEHEWLVLSYLNLDYTNLSSKYEQ